MKLFEPVERPRKSSRRSRYRNLSLVELVKKIVDKSDRLALEEFHNNRTLFRYSGRPPLLFTDFLKELRESAAKKVWAAPNAIETADKAYDLTIDKFNNLPPKKKSSRRAKIGTDRNEIKLKGSDCRLYFNAFLRGVTQSFETDPPTSQIDEEARAAMFLQGLVERHFHLSLLEAERRANPFWSRYYWRVKGGIICVWLPVSLEGRDRRDWLEKNIDDPDPLRPRERERIQSIIGRKFVRESFVPFNTDSCSSNKAKLLPWPGSGETFGISLAGAVAEEKTKNIRLQRWSIRALGEERLKELILRIFEDLNCGEYKDRKVARDFGISKATFSRFGGSRWLSGSAIPDLWRNTAEVLSAQPIFGEVAKNAGVWEQVQSTLNREAPQYGEGASHV